MISLEELIAANPNAPPQGSCLPTTTDEKILVENAKTEQRAYEYLKHRAQNFSTYHGSNMENERFFKTEDNYWRLIIDHNKPKGIVSEIPIG